MNSILFAILFLINFIKIKTEDELKDNKSSLRLLRDQEKSPKLSYSKFKYKSEEYNLIDRIRELNPVELFYKASATENKSFNVRCFWVDLETLRVYDLVKLKTKK